LRGFALESDLGRLMEQLSQSRFVELAQWRGTFSTQAFRERLRRFAAKPEAQLAERRINRFTQGEQWPLVRLALGVPHDMKYNILKRGISIVPVRAPAAGSNVHFHIAGSGCAVAKLNDGTTKVRPALDASKTGMKNLDFATIDGLQLLAQEPLVLPNGLQ
jgi:hypothetical protein